MSGILEHPEAQRLLDDTDVAPETLRGCAPHLTRFVQRYLPRFYREEQRRHADTIRRGKRTGLERKTTEPIARQARQKRRPLQHFVGAGPWDDGAVWTELRGHVREPLGHPDAVLVLDSYGVAKKGVDSCGVARQWCGHLGKVENCQVGVFLAYVAPRGKALLAGRLYLTRERAQDGPHRRQTDVPRGSSSKRNGGSAWTSSAGPERSCRTAGWWGTTSSGVPVSCERSCGSSGNATCSTCPAIPRCAT